MLGAVALPGSGLTNFEGNGFLVGNPAFATEGELAQTVLHELFRLGTSEIPELGVSSESAISETDAARAFAERAYEFLKELGLL